MAYEFNNYTIKTTLVAGESLTTAQYKFVKISNADGKAYLVNGATDRPIGVLQNNPASGAEAEIVIAGGTKVYAGGTASAGQPMFADANARAVVLAFGTTGSAAYNVGTFVTAGAASAVCTAVINCANAARGL